MATSEGNIEGNVEGNVERNLLSSLSPADDHVALFLISGGL